MSYYPKSKHRTSPSGSSGIYTSYHRDYTHIPPRLGQRLPYTQYYEFAKQVAKGYSGYKEIERYLPFYYEEQVDREVRKLQAMIRFKTNKYVIYDEIRRFLNGIQTVSKKKIPKNAFYSYSKFQKGSKFRTGKSHRCNGPCFYTKYGYRFCRCRSNWRY